MALPACGLVTKGCGNDLLCICKLCGGKAHFAILVLTRWCILYCDDQSKPLSFQIDGQRLSEQKLNVDQSLISQHFPICTHTVARPVVPSAFVPKPEKFSRMSTWAIPGHIPEIMQIYGSCAQ